MGQGGFALGVDMSGSTFGLQVLPGFQVHFGDA